MYNFFMQFNLLVRALVLNISLLCFGFAEENTSSAYTHPIKWPAYKEAGERNSKLDTNRNLIQRLAILYGKDINKNKFKKYDVNGNEAPTKNEDGYVNAPVDTDVQSKVSGINFGSVRAYGATPSTKDIKTMHEELKRLQSRADIPDKIKKEIANFYKIITNQNSSTYLTFEENHFKNIYGIYAPIKGTEPTDYIISYLQLDSLPDDVKGLLTTILNIQSQGPKTGQGDGPSEHRLPPKIKD